MGVRKLGTAELLILAAIVVGLTSYGGCFEQAQGSPYPRKARRGRELFL